MSAAPEIAVSRASVVGPVPPTSARGKEHEPALDGLRGIAVALVLVQHWIGGSGRGIDYGLLGVRLFFVLSGFLITGILLRGRGEIASRGVTPGTFARRFYIRRALRIFPLYYATLAGLWLFDAPGVRQEIGWHATYATSFLVARENHWIGLASHFWSLSVEEQFYLLWPWAVMFTPTRWLRAMFIALLLTGPVYRTAGLLLGFGRFALLDTLPASMDSLGVGALFALMHQQSPHSVSRARVASLSSGIVLLAVANAVTYSPGATVASHILGAQKGLGWALLFGAAVSAACARDRVWTKALSTAPLRALGRISYGVYVLHPMIPAALKELDAVPASKPLAVMLYASLTVVVAVASWRWFEAPFNRLKERFPYSGKPHEKPHASAPVSASVH